MSKIISKFFWICAGADSSLLSSEDCKTDRSKYVGIGALVLCVGVLAGLASSYAFYTVFDNPDSSDDDFSSLQWAIGFGVFWGLMIFNLDRFLVSTLKKDPPKDKWLEQIKAFVSMFLFKAAPRLVLALVLALLISKPLEMRIFKKEIEAEVAVIKAEKINNSNQKVKTNYEPRINEIEAQIRQAQADKETWREKWQAAQKVADDEFYGNGITNQNGDGPVHKRRIDEAATVRSEYDKIVKDRDSLIQSLTKERDDIKANLETAGNQIDTTTNLIDGLATRLDALSRISSNSKVVEYTGWLIFIAILLFEISPVLSKMLISYDNYDRLITSHEQKVSLRLEEESLKEREKVKRLSESKEARGRALLNIQENLLKNIDVKDSNVTLSEFNHYKRELLREAIADLRNSISNGKPKI